MKLICFETESCGFSTTDLEDAEFNIDFNKHIQICPECGSIAVLVNNNFRFTDNMQEKREEEMLQIIEYYRSLLKL